MFLPLVTPNIDLTYMVYMFQYDFVYNKVNGTVKYMNMKYVINREGISVFQEWQPTKIKEGDVGA